MSQQNSAELCTLMVDEIYGEASAKVVSVLLELGRQTIGELRRQTKLPEKSIKQTLVVLIQLHLVLHYTHVEAGHEVVYYDCDWQGCYRLLHAGRIIHTAEERFGTDGAMVVSNMLELGHARVSDFLAAYGRVEKAKGRGKKAAAAAAAEELPNGDAEKEIMSLDTLKALMAKMLEEKFLVQVEQHHMHPRTDTENAIRIEQTKLLQKKNTAQAKLAKEVESAVQERMKRLDDGEPDLHAGMVRLTGMKRKATTAKGGARKKKKTSQYDEGDGTEEEEWEIKEDIVLRVNHEKFLVVWRNEELVALAEQRLGKATSQVYAEFLRRIEPQYRRCQDRAREAAEAEDEKMMVKLSAMALLKEFPKDLDLASSIVIPEKKPEKKGKKRSRSSSGDESSHSESDSGKKKRGSKEKTNGKKKKKKKHDSDSERGSDNDSDEGDSDKNEWSEEDADSDADSDSGSEKGSGNKRMMLLRQHCELLAGDSYGFLKTHKGRSRNPEWSVPYPRLANRLRALEMERVVEERFSDTGTRLLRLLKDKGKLDEKQLASLAILRQNDIRATLSGLHECGHLDLQEVPKTNPPQTNRTYFLWYHDDRRANALLLSDVYKTMARTIQRTATERAKRQGLIEKSERSDVRENWDEYLTENDKRELEIWRGREEHLLVQLMRLDRVVMVLRDF